MKPEHRSLGAAFEALASLPDEIAGLRRLIAAQTEELREIKARLPPLLGDAKRVGELTGWSPATVRRRIADGSLRTVRMGRCVLVDLASLRPADDAEVARAAREARRK